MSTGELYPTHSLKPRTVQISWSKMLLAKNVYSILLLSLGFFLTQQDLTNTGGISLEEGIGTLRSFSGGVVVKNPHANAGDARDMALIPGSGRSPGEGNSNALQYSCLETSMDRGAWQVTVYGVMSWTQLRDSAHTHTHTHTHSGTYFLKVETGVPRK